MLADRPIPTILVVEDDHRLGPVLCRVLSRSGYEVEWAGNVAAAVADLGRPPAVALLDLHLPDGNGADLAAVLRARYPDLPMLLMTGCPFCLRERPQCAQYFRQVLQKPLELPELRNAISAALNQNGYAHDNATCFHR
jgi:DNA-binding response OmpR family regulator